MEILEHGTLYDSHHKFICHRCFCTFSAYPSESKIDSSGYYKCKCPECGMLANEIGYYLSFATGVGRYLDSANKG